MDEQDRWMDALDAERDREAERRESVELARRERLDEKGLPHKMGAEATQGPSTDGNPSLHRPHEFVCEPCECGGLCNECAEAA